MCFNYYCQPVQARVMLHLKVLWEILQSESKLLCEHNDIKEVKKSQQKSHPTLNDTKIKTNSNVKGFKR
jgi:hypothetical protein